MLLYTVNYLDRVNVGFAALTMNRDLGFSPSVYGFGAGLFYGGYLLFQIPASIMLERAGPRRALFAILTVWGTISASTAFVHQAVSFYTARFALGAAEAGFFPVMILYLTYWFPRSYRTRFTAMFMTAIPLASIIGGPVSGVLLQLQDTGGLKGWQLLFLAEGLPAVALAIAVLLFLPACPAAAWWLSPVEGQRVTVRVRADENARRRDVSSTLRDPRVIALGMVNFAILLTQNGLTLWLPQIVQTLGFSTPATSLLATLPAVAGLPAMICCGGSSDKRDERIWHIAIPGLIAALAFAAVSIAPQNLVLVLAIIIANAALLAMQPVLFAVIGIYLSGPALAGGVALVLSISNIASVIGPALIGVLKERTGSYSLSMILFAMTLSIAVVIVLVVGRGLSRPAVAPGVASA